MATSKSKLQIDSKKHVLLMWSGGIDSTYRLAWLLKETDYKVHAHHVVLRTKEERADAEGQAIRRMSLYMQQIRPFSYSENIMDFSELYYVVRDVKAVLFTAGVWSLSYLKHPQQEAFTHWSMGAHLGEEGRFEQWKTDLDHMFWRGFYDSEVSKDQQPAFELFPLVSKAEEIRYLEQECNISESWYCRTPVHKEGGMLFACGACHTCLEVAEARRLLGKSA